MVGDIYLAKIYFTDLSEYKIRPVLVIKELGEDCICFQLTTQKKENVFLVTQKDLVSGNLKKESFVVVLKNFTLHKSVLTKYLATLKSNIISDIIENFCVIMGCQKSL